MEVFVSPMYRADYNHAPPTEHIIIKNTLFDDKHILSICTNKKFPIYEWISPSSSSSSLIQIAGTNYDLYNSAKHYGG